MDIFATGMISPVGLSAAAACAAIRARVAGFGETPFLDRQGEPVIGAAVPWGETGTDHEPGARLLDLLAGAVRDCLNAEPGVSTERTPLLVGLAEPGRPGGGAGLVDTVVRGVEARLGVRFHPRRSRALATGHTAGFEALRAARECLNDPGVPACLVCGVDSYLNAESLAWLEAHERLKQPGNPDGVIPGEAAAAVLVRRPSSGSGTAPGAGCRVLGLGFGREAAAVMTDDPILGLGLTEATRAALAEAGRPLHETDFRLSDVTGESYGFREQALVLARLLRPGRASFPIWHCGDALGDTGAAAGVLQLVIARHAFLKGYAPGDRAVCFTSAVPGDRAAAVLGRA